MPTDPAAIAADREAGTPGPWIAFKPSYYWNIRTGDDTPFPDQLVCDVMESSAIYANSRAKPVDHGAANARRIARVPELEEAYLAEHAARIAAEAALTEMTRRRDEWRAKAEGYDAVRLALRDATKDPGERSFSRIVWSGIAADEKKRADDAEAEVKRLREELREIAEIEPPPEWRNEYGIQIIRIKADAAIRPASAPVDERPGAQQACPRCRATDPAEQAHCAFRECGAQQEGHHG